MLKNAFKVFFGNLTTAWRVLLYKLICLITTVGIVSAIASPIIIALIKDGYFVFLSNQINGNVFSLNIEAMATSLIAIVTNLFNIVIAHNLLALCIICIVIFIVLYYFLSMISELASVERISAFMSSYAKYSYLSCFVRNLRKSSLYVLTCIMLCLPLDLIIWAISALIIWSLSANYALAVFVAITFFVVAYALKGTLFSCFKTAVCTNDLSIFECLKKNCKVVKSRFFKLFGDHLIMALFLTMLCLVTLNLTVGAGLIILLPLANLLNNCYDCTVYFDSLGMRYYLDSNNIFSPKRLEEQDKLKKVKHII